MVFLKFHRGYQSVGCWSFCSAFSMVTPAVQYINQNSADDRYCWLQYLGLFFNKESLSKFDATTQDVGSDLRHKKGER